MHHSDEVHYLSLDLDLQNGANDGERVADDDQNVPTVHKLQLVRHWDFFIAEVSAVECVRLVKTKEKQVPFFKEVVSQIPTMEIITFKVKI